MIRSFLRAPTAALALQSAAAPAAPVDPPPAARTADAVQREFLPAWRKKIREDGYALRPEIVASNDHLWRLTDDPLYLSNAQVLFDDFVRFCRAEGGDAALSDVTSKTQRDAMDSDLFAQTFKVFWPPFDPSDTDAFVEGSAAQYPGMLPFNVRGLADALGGNDRTNRRLDAFFHHADGSRALTKAGGLHAELDNEPSIGSPRVHEFTGQPYRTQETIREVLATLWSNKPEGLPGNDDLGAMSSWYVGSASLYPGIPGRSELLLSSPLFARVGAHRPGGDLAIEVDREGADARCIQALEVNGQASSATWLPASLALHGGRLRETLSKTHDTPWRRAAGDAPPSFSPRGGSR